MHEKTTMPQHCGASAVLLTKQPMSMLRVQLPYIRSCRGHDAIGVDALLTCKLPDCNCRAILSIKYTLGGQDVHACLFPPSAACKVLPLCIMYAG